MNPLPGEHDLEHMQRLHKELFSKIYPWAGEVREFPLFKAGPDGLIRAFASPDEIYSINESLKKELKSTNHFKDLRDADTTTFSVYMADVYQKMNEMHPFREGNGRTQRLVIEQLADNAGRKLNYGLVEAAAWNYAAANSTPLSLSQDQKLNGRTDELVKVFDRIAVPKMQSSFKSGL